MLKTIELRLVVTNDKLGGLAHLNLEAEGLITLLFASLGLGLLGSKLLFRFFTACGAAIKRTSSIFHLLLLAQVKYCI